MSLKNGEGLHCPMGDDWKKHSLCAGVLFSLLLKVVHTRQKVATTCCGDMLQ